MNRVLNAAKLDFYAGKSALKTSAIMLFIAIVLGVVTQGAA